MKSKFQIRRLLPTITIWAVITHVHEYTSQEDTGDLTLVFHSPSFSFFSFLMETLSLQGLSKDLLSFVMYDSTHNSPGQPVSFMK